MRKKKREFKASELMEIFAKKNGFQQQLTSEKARELLEGYLDKSLFAEIQSVRLQGTTLEIRILSPLLKNDFRMRKSFFLKKFQDELGEAKVTSLQIL
ncbi:hypothetical protein [Chryseobacterium sp. A321]